MTNHSELWYAKLAWYSPRASPRKLLGLADSAFRAKFVEPSSYYTEVICLSLFAQQMFWVAFTVYGSVRTHKALDYVALSSVWRSNHTQREPMHNVSAHQLLQYNQPKRIPCITQNASVMWYTRRKQARYYQNVAKLLTHSDICENFVFGFKISTAIQKFPNFKVISLFCEHLINVSSCEVPVV